ncbi:GNAT family N-acetyltransferase [Streptomyces sp. NPDC127106]|uniref:GNAT family N-acetyltransferase n=1 Tax=Streptomyces sp. NPDC127106 TaxID=3345360 RepID=UPI0036254168
MKITGAHAIDRAVSLITRALRDAAHHDWTAPAAGLEWSCHDTAVHIVNDFTVYAARLAARAQRDLQVDRYTAPDAPPVELAEAIAAAGTRLTAVVAAADPDDRAWHPYGTADADGFAAMGVVEALVHTHDVLDALGVPDFAPDPELCDFALDRLFPHTPRDAAAPWPTLLWATGRTALPGLPRLGAWRWYAAPVPAGDRIVLCEITPDVADDLHTGGSGGFAWPEDGPGEGTRYAAGMKATAYREGAYRLGWGAYAVVRTHDRRAIGGIGFHAAPDADGNVEVGYDLVPSARGNGFATDALNGLAAWAFGQPGPAVVLHARVDEDNTPSRGVVERAGFERTGTAGGEVRYALRAPGGGRQ